MVLSFQSLQAYRPGKGCLGIDKKTAATCQQVLSHQVFSLVSAAL